ncbi:MAG: coproporphyrinogen-III oxidase family protein [Bacteriovoracaceae bacterium]
MKENKSLYIHYPYCKHLCNYCDFYKLPLANKMDYGVIESGLRKNHGDIVQLAKAHGASNSGAYETIYLGGGTPSLWDEEGAEFLSGFFSENKIYPTEDCEFTMEVDPGAWTFKGLSAWKKTGVNRFSAGVQAFDEAFLKIMDRNHDLAQVKSALAYFKEQKENFSADLMLGLPFSVERKRDPVEELKRILDYEPSHLSVYILKARKNYPHKAALPEDEYISEEYLQVSSYLKERGFDHYEVSNYGLPQKQSKHNLKYWRAGSVEALGPNATGFLRINEQKALRYQHKPSGNGLSLEILDEKQLALEEVYLALRTSYGLDLAKYFGQAKLKFKDLAAKWLNLGFVERFDGGRLVLNAQGFLMIDSLMDDLFLYDLI